MCIFGYPLETASKPDLTKNKWAPSDSIALKLTFYIHDIIKFINLYIPKKIQHINSVHLYNKVLSYTIGLVHNKHPI